MAKFKNFLLSLVLFTPTLSFAQTLGEKFINIQYGYYKTDDLNYDYSSVNINHNLKYNFDLLMSYNTYDGKLAESLSIEAKELSFGGKWFKLKNSLSPFFLSKVGYISRDGSGVFNFRTGVGVESELNKRMDMNASVVYTTYPKINIEDSVEYTVFLNYHLKNRWSARLQALVVDKSFTTDSDLSVSGGIIYNYKNTLGGLL